MLNLLSWLGAAHEVAFLLLRVAPRAVRIPVPGFDHQFGVLPVGHGLPSRVEDDAEQRIGEEFLRAPGPQPVNRRAQGVWGTKRVDHVRGRCIDGDGLCHGQAGREKAATEREEYFEESSLHVTPACFIKSFY